MTGAPKIKAMELIEQLECTKRGIYAGAVGYFMPNDNFDFNVVIRSIAYNQATQTLAYQVGGAITYDSQPEAEYQECMLKAESMQKALKN
jgi:para-aminobenzoate synthetase component 1